MNYYKIVQFPFEPVQSRGKEMIAGKIAVALSELSRENGRAMRPVSVNFLSLQELWMVVCAEPVVSDYETAIVEHIQRIEKTINPPERGWKP